MPLAAILLPTRLVQTTGPVVVFTPPTFGTYETILLIGAPYRTDLLAAPHYLTLLLDGWHYETELLA